MQNDMPPTPLAQERRSRLRRAYLDGRYSEAFPLARDLAYIGDATAQHTLALLYAVGVDGRPDYVNAWAWLMECRHAGGCLEDQDVQELFEDVEAKMSEAQKGEAMSLWLHLSNERERRVLSLYGEETLRAQVRRFEPL